jgi:hypothetical protein
MQLKKIKAQMGLATCTLLQIATPGVQAADSEWDVDTAVLFYSESDGRVSAFEPAIYAGKELNDGDRIDLKLVVDVLTGASPNGAHASSVAQTFTTPSGNSTYTIQPGETPLDDTFRDTRVSFGADWTLELDRLSRLTLGTNISQEYDYQSLGLSAAYARDFNDRNTTLTASFGYNNDTIDSVGGMPVALQPMVTPGAIANRSGTSDDKTISDVLFGITQVINRNTFVQLNYSFGQTDGYQNDAYKVLSVIDPVTGVPVTASGSTFFDTATTGNRPYVYESRPDSRQRNNLYFKAVHHLEEDVVNLSYRYYWDDWEVKSHTLDLNYRYQLQNSYLQPHIRYYKQDAAEFYKHNLSLGSDVDATTGAVNRQYASNDYRLAESETMTVGLKYGIPVGDNSEFSVRGEFIRQTVNDGSVPDIEKTPDLDAILLQVSYSLVW